jgi:glutamate carboxypeptidase
LELEGGINRPPMERTEGVASLYGRASAIARDAGWELGEGESGGASDGSFTAGLGVPTLDGIGPTGGGAHSADEHVDVADLPRRVALYRRLLEAL